MVFANLAKKTDFSKLFRREIALCLKIFTNIKISSVNVSRFTMFFVYLQLDLP